MPPSSVRSSRWSRNHRGFPIIGTLYQNVGPNRLDQAQRRCIGEYRHEVHILQARQNQCTGLDRVEGPGWTFESTHAGVAIQANDKAIGLSSRFSEVLNMTGVKYIEAPVGESHFKAGLTTPIEFRKQWGKAEDLGRSRNSFIEAERCMKQVGQDFLARNSCDTDL